MCFLREKKQKYTRAFSINPRQQAFPFYAFTPKKWISFIYISYSISFYFSIAAFSVLYIKGKAATIKHLDHISPSLVHNTLPVSYSFKICVILLTGIEFVNLISILLYSHLPNHGPTFRAKLHQELRLVTGIYLVKFCDTFCLIQSLFMLIIILFMCYKRSTERKSKRRRRSNKPMTRNRR